MTGPLPRRARLLPLVAILLVVVPAVPATAALPTVAAATIAGAAVGGPGVAGPAVAGPAVAGPAVATAAVATRPGADWSWPVSPPIRVLAPYRAPAHPYGPGHRGIDLAASTGAEVRAAADGTVAFAGMVAGRPVVSLAHGDGVVSSIEPVASSLAVGDAVRAGEPIGTVDAGGHCAGCVHFGVRIDGVYVSPFLFLGGLPRAVLLPEE